MTKIIINADDCGISKSVDAEIEKCIQKGQITSTTIMANMDDFEGACRLYAKYNDRISFGVHLNLTEGAPLTDGKKLVEIGVAEFTDDKKIVFCGNKLRKHHFNKKQRRVIYDELEAQIMKIIDAGIHVSHIDGHHHIHTDFWILVEVVKLARKYKIRKIRAMSNVSASGISAILRKCWRLVVRCLYPSVKITDYFTSYTDYVRRLDQLVDLNGTLELMTHPGGYEEDEARLMETSIPLRCSSLITYKDL